MKVPERMDMTVKGLVLQLAVKAGVRREVRVRMMKRFMVLVVLLQDREMQLLMNWR